MNTDMSDARRSSRPHKVASCGEEADIEHPPLRKRAKTNSSKRYIERKPHKMKVATTEERANAMDRAEKLKNTLQHQSFIRSMVKSHVYTCYWLGIPTQFCKDHLPNVDQNMILENEKGEEHETNFLARRTGLSGGWRAFAIKHKLHDGDAVVFELTKPTRFKVHILRAHGEPEAENDAMVTQFMEDQKMEDVDEILEEKAAPKPRDDSRKQSRRKSTKPVKSFTDNGVSSSKIVEEDIDDEILNGAAATNNKGGAKNKLFRRRRSVTKTRFFSSRRTWS